MSFVKPHMREQLKDHALEELTKPDAVIRAFRLKPPERTRIMSTLIVFTPEGIVLLGDLKPQGDTNGVVSVLGYGLDWFRSQLSERYLCEKFLRKRWQPEAAILELDQMLKDLHAEGDQAETDGERAVLDKREALFRKARHDLEICAVTSPEELGCAFRGGGYDFDDLPGYDYPLGDAGWLCAIQEKFAERFRCLVGITIAEVPK